MFEVTLVTSLNFRQPNIIFNYHNQNFASPYIVYPIFHLSQTKRKKK